MLGNIISAGASLLGGLIGKNSADETRAQQLRLAEQNRQDQITFAKEGLTWKIDDAMKNADRVHPIYSLGVSGPSFSPVSANFASDTSMPNALASAGQDIGRAVNATATGSQKLNALQTVQLEGLQLDNEAKKIEIASKVGRMRQNSSPNFPSTSDNYLIPGQAESSGVKPKALEVAPGHPGRPSAEQGSIADSGYARTNDGFAPVPSKDVKERIEDNIIQEVLHAYRNNLLPSLGHNMSPPPFDAPDGKEWWFNTLRQEYQLFNKGDRPTMGHRWKGK